jgi:adenine/guanine phosphoribosyltransferase-like PRPP-binding protein
MADADIRALWRRSSERSYPAATALNFRTIADLNRVIKRHLHRIGEFEFVVGVPRSGLLPATMLALHLNLPMVAMADLLRGDFGQRLTSRGGRAHRRLHDPRTRLRALVVDDSINTGRSLRRTKELLAQSMVASASDVTFTFLAVFAGTHDSGEADLSFETVPGPRLFEWNLMHHTMLGDCLVDLDGVLCPDGPGENSNDGGAYERHIAATPPKILPTFRIGAVVTSRLERYRALTAAWLAKHGIDYDELIMLDLESAEQRRAMQIHSRYKADVYEALGGLLFVESDHGQAFDINKRTGRPTFCVDAGAFYPAR